MKVHVNGNTIEIHMTKQEAAQCSHTGECEADCDAMVEKHPILMKRMKRDTLIGALRKTGGWTVEELSEKTDTELRTIAVWMAACDIRENEGPQGAHGWAYLG